MRYRFQSTQRSRSYILVPRAAILLASASARSVAPAKRIVALGTRMKFIPKRVVVPRLNDTVANFRTEMKFFLQYRNRGELSPV